MSWTSLLFSARANHTNINPQPARQDRAFHAYMVIRSQRAITIRRLRRMAGELRGVSR